MFDRTFKFGNCHVFDELDLLQSDFVFLLEFEQSELHLLFNVEDS
jgi:hypothetical protein